jgi:putative iron-dependent peroxidase
MPFGSPGRQEFGTYYIGYAASAGVTEQMLENMFIGDPPGNTDRILDFSTAITGTLFFAPSADFLDDLPDPPASAATLAAGDDRAQAPSPPAPTTESSGSLGIGSLRRSTSP